MIITIDGPVASGKTTVGKLLAKRLIFDYLYSGFLYRSIAYALLEHTNHTINTFSTLSISDLDSVVEQVALEYCFMADGNCQIRIHDGVIQEDLLMTPLIDRAASMLGLNNNVRTILTDVQRKLAHERNVIVDGRDAGTIVFPHAEYKFFLTASLDVRIQRYIKRQKKIGRMYTQEEAKKIIIERDTRDGRWLSIPNLSDNLISIDTSNMTQDQLVDFILNNYITKHN
ncbi:(d)CMP kinase [Candidatus Dependentiae bacterium]|nr:MAG: (d)CMP kinase [Candidatus Dependentiae bacterium]